MSAWKRNRLWLLRAERRLSQEKLAHRVGISQPQMSLIERAVVEPDDKLRARIAKVLKVPVEALESAAAS